MPSLTAGPPDIPEDCEVVATTFGAYCEVGRGTRLTNVEMGDYSYCDRFCDLANARIGKFSNIASYVRIGATDHPLETASLHHFLYRSAKYFDTGDQAEWFEKRAARLSHIGHDTWIGHNAQIKPEVTIGHGAVIASGAIVTKDVDPYVIMAGLPAKPVRRRHPHAIAERLMQLAWWDWDHATLEARLDDFRHLPAEAFLEKYG